MTPCYTYCSPVYLQVYKVLSPVSPSVPAVQTYTQTGGNFIDELVSLISAVPLRRQ